MFSVFFLSLFSLHLFCFVVVVIVFLSFAHRIAPWVININIDIVDKRIVFPSNFHLPFSRRDSEQPTRWLIPPSLRRVLLVQVMALFRPADMA